MEVAVRDAPTPIGRAILDADLPAPSPWRPAQYLLPLAALGAHVVAESERDGMAKRLSQELAVAHDAEAVALLRAEAKRPMPVDEAIQTTLFRFPNVTSSHHDQLFMAACFGDEAPTKAELQALDKITRQLRLVG
jgi:hypothetical protein